MKKVKLINLTNRDVSIMTENGIEVLRKEKKTVMVSIKRFNDSKEIYVNGFRIKSNKTIISNSEVKMPPKKEGVAYLVSSVAYNSLCDSRDDVYALDMPKKESGNNTKYCDAVSRTTFESKKVLAKRVKKFISKLLCEETFAQNGKLFDEAYELLVNSNEILDN